MNNRYSQLLNELRDDFSKIAASTKGKRKIISVYLYGQNTEYIIADKDLVSDEVDLVIVVDNYLKPGQAPVTNKGVKLIEQRYYRKRKLRTTFNGITPADFNPRRELLLDVIGEGMINIKDGDPSSIICALKPKILLFGPDCFYSLSSTFLSKNQKLMIFKTRKRYIEREFIDNPSLNSQKSISKNMIFLASLAYIDTIKMNDKNKIFNYFKTKKDHSPNIIRDLQYFLNIYNSKTIIDWSELRSHYLLFCSYYVNEVLIHG